VAMANRAPNWIEEHLPSCVPSATRAWVANQVREAVGIVQKKACPQPLLRVPLADLWTLRYRRVRLTNGTVARVPLALPGVLIGSGSNASGVRVDAVCSDPWRVLPESHDVVGWSIRVPVSAWLHGETLLPVPLPDGSMAMLRRPANIAPCLVFRVRAMGLPMDPTPGAPRGNLWIVLAPHEEADPIHLDPDTTQVLDGEACWLPSDFS
jgi:hypothetical protein